MRNSSNSALLSLIILLLIASGTLFFRLGGLPFLGADEPRYARIAEEMQVAHRWVTPTLESHPWLEKPPLYYWITIPFFALFGAGEFTARVGPAVLALLALAAVYLQGRRLLGESAGVFSVAILSTSLGFVAFGRSASTDMPLAAAHTIAMALFWTQTVEVRGTLPRALLAYAFLGLAVLAKGPVSLILAAGSGALFWWLDDGKENLRKWRITPGMAVLALVSIPWFWFAYRENGFAFISVFFLNHNLARFVTDIHHHSEPFYYFVPVLLGFFFPWTGWLTLLRPGGLVRRNLDRETLFLWCWFLFPFLFFSISRSKLPGYILPCFPPLALLIGKEIASLIEGSAKLGTSRVLAWSHLGTSLLLAGAAPMIFWRSLGGNWRIGIPLSLSILIPALLVFFWGLKGRTVRMVWGTVGQGFGLILALALFTLPVIGDYHSARDIARAALSARRGPEPIVTFRFFHHALHYYSGYQVADDLSDNKALSEFAHSHAQFLAVTENSRIEELGSLQGFEVHPLFTQGKLQLFRIVRQ